MTATSGRLGRVLDAVHRGASTPHEVSRESGLSVDLVRVALDQLERAGALRPTSAGGTCAADACGSCSSGCIPADGARSGGAASGVSGLRIWSAAGPG